MLGGCLSVCMGLVSAGTSKKEMEVATGTVKWFNGQKGFGFIAPEDGGDDVFVHHSNIDSEGYRNLDEGQRVEYEPGQGKKGPEATKVRPL